MARDFNEILNANRKQGKFLCVGLDPDLEKIPQLVRGKTARESIVSFNRAIVDATKDVVCAYKPNSAFYEAHGEDGFAALRETIFCALEKAPSALILLDAKRGDIGNTNEQYAISIFDYLKADAVTLHPYTGAEGLGAFLARKDKGSFIYCRSSNEGAKEFQDMDVDGEPLYMHVARNVATEWNGNGNCGLVLGATYPEEIAKVRSVAPKLPFLVPGVGAQGGDLAESVRAAKDGQGAGFIISVSRSILYSSSSEDFAEAARDKALEFDRVIRDAL